MINKKIGILTLGLALVSLASCGDNGGDKRAVLTFCGPDSDEVFLKGLAEEFNAAHKEDLDYRFEFDKIIGEGEVKTEVLKDVTAAPDVVLLADDNVRDLVAANAIVEWTAEETTAMIAQSGATAVGSMQLKGKTYGIPYRGDNGYQLIYDKDLVTADDVKSLEGLLAKAKENGWKVGYNFTEPWYVPAPFFANGVKIEYDANDEFVCDIASSGKGVEVMMHYSQLWNDYKDTIVNEAQGNNFGPSAGVNRKCAQIIWNAYGTVRDAIGEDKVGVAQLPTVKLGGVDKQLYTYAGYKGAGVINKGRDAAAVSAAKEFVKFITNTANQEKRLVELEHGVTDASVVAKTELWKNPFLNSLAAQQVAGKSVVQATHARQTWWDAGKTLMETVLNQEAVMTEDEAKAALLICETAVLKND